MSDEIDGSGYTRGGGHRFTSSDQPWDVEPVTIAYEWEERNDLTGEVYARGPIIDGVIFGGPQDGRRIAPPRPPSPLNITFDPEAFTTEFDPDR